ncbi:protein phosphatase 1M isoform X4 [Ornithorhynchus anatinus]|uniref:Protein phosphatase, Mg2+/Mn2+ dependent 1M n=1 Tax=Ornithorhynchus anatinus TaxID=9258 RepID=A0A6I8P0U5_ORNAN|nr:protein phosphatase 1M isoform X4 [Ornithorhynchus anatinus]
MTSDWFRKRFLGKTNLGDRGQEQTPGRSTPAPTPPLYCRPKFLRGVGLEAREPGQRPVYSPARDHPLPWHTGYAEVINAEKSEFNEDQAVCCPLSIRRREGGSEEEQEWLILCQEEDEVIGQEMETMGQSSGCTALAVLYLQGKLYVANAGDSRAILVQKHGVMSLSSEFTPETERQRIQYLAFVYPKLLADEFTRLEFPRRLKGDDVGQKVLYRDYGMTGWGYKRVEKADLKYPLVHGQGRQARLLGTLAVTRGLGDHQLKVLDTDIEVKPFLSSIPQVHVMDLELPSVGKDDIIIMATDGLWDILSSEQVAQVARSFLQKNRGDPYRFSELAQALIYQTQGKETIPQGTLDRESLVSYDDVSVFVIPLHKMERGNGGS